MDPLSPQFFVDESVLFAIRAIENTVSRERLKDSLKELETTLGHSSEAVYPYFKKVNEELGWSRSTANRRRKSGKIVVLKDEHSVYITQSALNDYIEGMQER